MKISFDSRVLKEKIGALGRCVGAQSVNPVLANLHCRRSDAHVTLSATNLEQMASADAPWKGCEPAESDSPERFLLPAEKVSAILSKGGGGKDDLFHVTVSPGKIHVQYGIGKYQIPWCDPDSFPADFGFGVAAPRSFRVAAGALLRLIDRTRFAAGAVDSKFALSGILLAHRMGQARMVATDTKQLAVAAEQSLGGSDEPFECLLPRKLVDALRDSLAAADADLPVEVSLNAQNTVAKFAAGGFEVVGRLLHGRFPPYQEILSKAGDGGVDLDVEAKPLLAAIQASGLDARAESPGVTWEVGPDRILMRSQNDSGVSESEMPLAVADCPRVSVRFDPQLLCPALKSIRGESVRLRIASGKKPIYLVQDDYQFLCMPLES